MQCAKVTLIVLLTLLHLKMRVQDSERNPKWWEKSVIYQIYPRSFQDSNGDGIGDLKGIQSRLDYLVELGIDIVWICPIFKSPMKDFGYDVSDYRDVDPIFGTLQDLKDLISAMHDRELKLVLDFIPNHSSDQHQWFIKSEAREEPYTDYYVWRDPKGFDADGKPIPPNNWLSRFWYSAWTYHEGRGQFYFHQYLPEQPDLNYRNEKVFQEMKDVLKFWLDFGVDGFRFDAVRGLFEDELLRDEPISGKSDNPNDYRYLDHIYTWNLPETKSVGLAQFYQTVKDHSSGRAVCMLEAQYDRDFFSVSDFPFNFGFFDYKTMPSAEQVKEVVERTLNETPEGEVPNWILSSHDDWRVGNKFGRNFRDAYNVILLTLPGIAVVYYGEEIGMLNNMDISFEETVDPRGRNRGPEKFNDQLGSRDPERTPMQWDFGPNAGFTSAGFTPWLPLNKNFRELNVQNQINQNKSHLNIFKRLINLRKTEPLLQSGTTTVSTSGEVLIIRRQDPRSAQQLLVVVNLGHTEITADLKQNVFPTPLVWEKMDVLLDTAANAVRANSNGKMSLKPGQAVVLKLS